MTELIDWVEKNKDIVKLSKICKRAGVDKSNFYRYYKQGKIPEKYIEPLVNVVKELGFFAEIKKDIVDVKSTKHPLWKENDPKENTAAFFIKYECNNYDELTLKK